MKSQIWLLRRGIRSATDAGIFNLVGLMGARSTAICLHLFHPEVDAFILEYLQWVQCDFSLYITHNNELDQDTIARLRNIRKPKHILHVENRGRDVKPFLEMLPIMRNDGVEFVFKLHSKRGGTGLGHVWMRQFIDTMIREGEQMFKVREAMANNPDIVLAGPSSLYKSTRVFDFGNQKNVDTIAKLVYGEPAPGPYGFFAGTMFAARLSSYDRFIETWFAPKKWFRKDRRPKFEPEPLGVNGFLPHAFERFFGLIPLLERKKVLLVDGNLSMREYSAPGPANEANMNEFLSLAAGYRRISSVPTFEPVVLRGSNFEKIGEKRGEDWHGLNPGQKPLFWRHVPMPWE